MGLPICHGRHRRPGFGEREVDVRSIRQGLALHDRLGGIPDGDLNRAPEAALVVPRRVDRVEKPKADSVGTGSEVSPERAGGLG